MASPGFEPETFSVLDWRDNQLHHDTPLVSGARLINIIHLRAIPIQRQISVK